MQHLFKLHQLSVDFISKQIHSADITYFLYIIISLYILFNSFIVPFDKLVISHIHSELFRFNTASCLVNTSQLEDKVWHNDTKCKRHYQDSRKGHDKERIILINNKLGVLQDRKEEILREIKEQLPINVSKHVFSHMTRFCER